jgi:hypothetical protein
VWYFEKFEDDNYIEQIKSVQKNERTTLVPLIVATFVEQKVLNLREAI